MTEQRPQYGEIATPEEQRRAAGLPPLEAIPAVTAPPLATSPAPRAPDAVGARRRHPVDRMVTIGLLAYGLLNVIFAGLSYLDLATVMNQSMEVLGIEGEFTNFAQGRLWGTIAAIVLVVGWSLTAWLSIRRLRSGKISWWVPLIGAVATIAVVSVCISVPMFSDPAFLEYLDGMSAR